MIEFQFSGEKMNSSGSVEKIDYPFMNKNLKLIKVSVCVCMRMCVLHTFTPRGIYACAQGGA